MKIRPSFGTSESLTAVSRWGFFFNFWQFFSLRQKFKKSHPETSGSHLEVPKDGPLYFNEIGDYFSEIEFLRSRLDK